MGASNSTVQLVINVVDANSGEVIQTTTKNFDLLGNAAVQSGRKVAAGMQEASASVTRTAAASERGTTSSVAGFRRMSAEHASMVGKIKSQQEQVQKDLGRALTGTSGFGSSSFTGGAVSDLKRVSEAAQNAAGHSRSALDNVRLAIADLGIRVPRAMEKVIASSSTAMNIIGSLGTAMIALGAIKIAFDIGKGLYDGYEKLQDVNSEMRKYSQQAAESATQKIVDTQSIEEANALLKQTQDLMTGLDKKRAEAQVGEDNSGSIAQYLRKFFAATAGGASESGNMIDPGKPVVTYGAADDQQRANLAKQRDLLRERQEAIDAKRNVDQQEAKASADGMRLTGYAATEAARQNTARLAELKQQQAKKEAAFQRDAVINANELIRQQNPKATEQELQEKGLKPVPVVAQNLGDQDRDDARVRANMEASAKNIASARKENEEIAQARAQARQAGLQGEQLYRAQLQATIDGFNRRVADSELSSAAAHKLALDAKARFDAEYQQRYRSQVFETERLEADARAAGLTGLARGDAESSSRQASIQKSVTDTTLDPELGRRQIAANAASTAAEQAKSMDDFAQHIQQMDDSRANSSMSANQRIDAETRRTVAEIKKTWDDLYGQLKVNDVRRVQGQVALNAEIARIQASGAQQKQQVERQLEDETRKLQDEAARGGGGNTYAQQYRSVEAELNDHLRRIAELRQQAGVEDVQAQQQYEAQELAYRQIAYNKELDLARQQRDKLAGELKGFMANPLEALKRQGEDIASKAAADLLMGHLPAGIGGNRAGAPGASNSGFDAIFRPFNRGRVGGVPGAPGTAHDAHQSIAPQQAIVNATTATINVTSATFSGGAASSGTPGAIAKGGYVPSGNGGYFNLGSSPSNEPGSPAAAQASGSFGSLSADGIGSSSSPLATLTSSSDPFSASGTSNPFSSAVSGAKTTFNQADSIGKDLGVFGKDANGNANGLASKIPGLKNISSENLGKLGGTAGGALGVFSAFEGKGGFGGAASGALSGFQAGSQFGGVAGGLIGAAIGGIAGFIGHGARVEAQKYWFKELMPKAQADMLAFGAGSLDYQSAYNDFQSMESEAKQRTRQMGSGAVGYYDDTIKPRIESYLQKLTREQKAGRSQVGMSAAQFHNGGFIGGFGSMATGPDTGWIHTQMGEAVLNQQAAMSHGDVAMMMNAGASRSDIADYLGGGGSGTTRAVQNSPVELHFNSHDAKGAYQLFMDNKHTIREALNGSYGENSGGGDFV